MNDSNSFCGKCGAKLGSDNNFCPKCGVPVLSDLPNKETIRTRPKKTKKKGIGTIKQIGIGLGAFILLMFVIGGLISSTDDNTSNDNSNLDTSNRIISQSEFGSMTVTRDDLGTEWKRAAEPQYDDRNYFYKKAGIEYGSERDLTAGASYYSFGYVKGAGFDTSLLDIYIYRYDTPEQAKAFYDQFLGIYKSIGGYKEWNTGINGCYGGHVVGSGLMDKIAMYCLKGNMVTFLSSAGQEYDLKQDIPKIAKAIHSKF